MCYMLVIKKQQEKDLIMHTKGNRIFYCTGSLLYHGPNMKHVVCDEIAFVIKVIEIQVFALFYNPTLNPIWYMSGEYKPTS